MKLILTSALADHATMVELALIPHKDIGAFAIQVSLKTHCILLSPMYNISDKQVNL